MGIEEVLEKGKDQSQRMEGDYLRKRGRVHLRERESMVGDSGVVLGMVRSRLREEGSIEQWFSKCGPQTSNISITYGPIRDANFLAPPQI